MSIKGDSITHKIICIFIGILAFLNLVNAESNKVAKPSFDCTKAKSEVEKMICSDESGELQRLDREMAETYSNLKAKLNLQSQKELLDSQRLWLKQLQQCKSKECVRKTLQSRITKISSLGKEYKSLISVWSGTWTLKQNLYSGSFIIKNCNEKNICEIQYSATLAKSEFNDMHICQEVSMRLKIKSNKAIAYYEGEGNKCELYLEFDKMKNSIVVSYQNPKDCDMGCGVGTEISIKELYSKEL